MEVEPQITSVGGKDTKDVQMQDLPATAEADATVVIEGSANSEACLQATDQQDSRGKKRKKPADMVRGNLRQFKKVRFHEQSRHSIWQGSTRLDESPK